MNGTAANTGLASEASTIVAKPMQDPPRQRIVVLGASNVIRGISTVISTAERFRREPLDCVMATGHGRSYGLTSRVLGRTLPAIRSCALWESLANRPHADTVSLVTDIGNDLLYGASVETIVAWVDECLARLRPISKHIILTEVPWENVARLNPANFFLIRSILFPQSRLTLVAARDMAVDLNDRIKLLARKYETALVKPDPTWYGVDPIHIHRRHLDRAWQQILATWSVEMKDRNVAPSPHQRIPLRQCRPHLRWLFGIEQRRSQPALHLPSGTRVSFF